MIIRDGDRDTVDRDHRSFTLVSADRASELTLALPDGESDEFRAYLADRGFRFPVGSARSVVTEVIVATAANPAAWAAVGSTIVAFFRRNRGKTCRFDVEGQTFSAGGYSDREARRLAAAMSDLIRDRKSGATTPNHSAPLSPLDG